MTSDPKGKPSARKIRLNRLLAQYGLCSRRQADEWIEAGRVSVDGAVCRSLGTQIDPLTQKVEVDGKTLRERPPRLYLALNKPRGVISTRRDPHGRKNVVDLLPPEARKAGVFPVGRLDTDSEGLLLLTNDGDWAQILLHPRHEVWKEYRVETDIPLTPVLRKKLEEGVELEDGRTLPAQVRNEPGKSTEKHCFLISIRESRNRQIRRMCAALGMKVLRLTRICIGSIRIGKTPSGGYRELDRREIETVRGLLRKKQAKSSNPQKSD